MKQAKRRVKLTQWNIAGPTIPANSPIKGYLVFEDFDLSKYADMPPNLRMAMTTVYGRPRP